MSEYYDRVIRSRQPSNKPNAVHGREPVYILSAVNIKELSKDDLKTEFEIFKLRYPKNKNQTFEEFLKYKAEFHETKYEIETYDTAYFLHPDTADYYARTNMADINESGAYPYLVIYSRPTDHMYCESYPTDVRIYEYSKDTDQYTELPDPNYHEFENIEETDKHPDHIKHLYIKHAFDPTVKLPEE